MPQADARAALKKFIEDRKLTLRSASEGVGVTHPALKMWLDGDAKPSAPHRQAIEKWTDGQVPAELWLEAHEIQKILEIEPCRAPIVSTDVHPPTSESTPTSASGERPTGTS
jgi:hypothetical protein